MRTNLLLATLLLLPPVALATASEHIDASMEIQLDGSLIVDDPATILELVNATPRENYAWNLTTTKVYTVIEIQSHGGFDIQSARQLVPQLFVAGTQYPLFEPVYRTEVWDVDSPARISNSTGQDGEFTLRLGIPGPVNATLLLERDITPPGATLGPIQNLTFIGFYAEATVNELAVADLQIREAGKTEWVNNPTTVYHFLHYFPVQGLDAERTYEYRLIVNDWAGNTRTLDTQTLQTPVPPVLDKPRINALSPEPNSTIDGNVANVSARIEPTNGSLQRGGLRVFLDKRNVQDGWTLEGDQFNFTTPPLEAGLHTIAITARQEGGGETEAFWSFRVASRDAPAPGVVGIVVLLGLLAAPSKVIMARRGGIKEAGTDPGNPRP